MTNERKAEVFDNMVSYLVEVQGMWETVWTLTQYDMSKEEINEVINDYLNSFRRSE